MQREGWAAPLATARLQRPLPPPPPAPQTDLAAAYLRTQGQAVAFVLGGTVAGAASVLVAAALLAGAADCCGAVRVGILAASLVAAPFVAAASGLAGSWLVARLAPGPHAEPWTGRPSRLRLRLPTRQA